MVASPSVSFRSLKQVPLDEATICFFIKPTKADLLVCSVLQPFDSLFLEEVDHEGGKT